MAISQIGLEAFSNTYIDYKLGDMAARIAVQTFDYRYATFLFFNSTLYYDVELFLQVFHYNVIVNRGIIDPNLTKITPQYVIFGSDVTEFQLMLDTIKELKMKNTGKFIIVCQSQKLNDCDEKEMTALFWVHNIVDVVIIKSEKELAVSYTYYPISQGTCNNVNPVQIKKSNSSQYLTTNYGNIFSMKLKKLSFCPLFVSTFIQTPYMNIINGTPIGADGDLLRIIANGLNTTVKMMTPHIGNGWGFRLKNRTWTGSLADIYGDLANISMTSSTLTLSRFSDFDMSRSYYTKHVGWVTHPPMLQNAALKLLQPFGTNTRIALVVSYLLVILCAFVVKTDKWSSILYNIQENQQSKSVVFYSWMICMGQAVKKLPTKYALLQITTLWIYYCFVIRTVYQVYLISSLKGNFYEDEIQTIEDAIKANYPIGGAAALQEYYINYPLVYNNWIVIDTAEIIPTIFNISKGQKFVLAVNLDTVNLITKIHKISLHILPQKVASSPTVIFLKKYSPLTESINLVLSRLVAAGFPDTLLKKYTSVKSVAGVKDNQMESLTIIHFTACYMILVTGWVLSFALFLLEFYFGKIYKHQMTSPLTLSMKFRLNN